MLNLDPSEKFIRQSMRHLARLNQTESRTSLSSASFPKGWFDLPESVLADLGAFFFLASLTPFHRPRTLAVEFASFEPPLRLKQYKIFRSNGFPRAFVTWAGLDPAAERQFAVDGAPLSPGQWNSGPSKWVIDLVAPFGHLEQMIKAFARNERELRIRTLWHNRKGTRARVIEWARASGDTPIKVSSYGQAQFARILDEA